MSGKLSTFSDKNVNQCGWTEFIGKEFRYLWTIHNYFNVDVAKTDKPLVMKSPIFCDELINVTWFLEFEPDQECTCPRTISDCKHRPRITLVSLTKPRVDSTLWVTIDVLDMEGSVYSQKHVSATELKDCKCRCDFAPSFQFTIPYKVADHITSLLHNGNLRILVRMWTTGSAPSGSGVRHAMTPEMQIEGKPITELGRNLKSLLFDDPRFADTIVCAGDKRIRAQKAVLAARSVVFYKIFENPTPMTERGWACIRIENFSAEVVYGMVEYIYSDATEIKPENAEEFLRIADEYKLEGLKLDAAFVLFKNISLGNVVELYKYSLVYNCDELKTFVKDFVSMNKMKIASNPALEQLAKTHLKDVLKLFASAVN